MSKMDENAQRRIQSEADKHPENASNQSGFKQRAQRTVDRGRTGKGGSGKGKGSGKQGRSR